jgi:hypothetical protein
VVKPSGFSGGFGPGFGVGRYHYGFAQYQWITEGGISFWRLPSSVVGAVDLRPIPNQATPITPGGFAFVASLQPVDVLVSRSLHFADEDVTGGMQDAWEAETGYRPQGAKLVDLLFDQLTNGSDPDGVTGPKPLMAGVDQMLRLFVGGHSEVKRQRFSVLENTPHADRVRTLLQRDYERYHAQDSDHARRVLDFWCEKYRLDKQDKSQWQRLIPQRLRAGHRGLLPHSTTITESFNTGNGGTLGPDLTWGEFTNDFAGNASTSTSSFDIAGNTAQAAAIGVLCLARAESDLSGDDHYAQGVLADIETDANYQLGPACRFEVGTGDNSLYFARALQVNDTLALSKLVNGTLTDMGTPISQAPANTATVKVSADGSTIKSYYNGAEKQSETDTSITGNLRCGIFGFTSGAKIDTFEAADIAAGSSVSPDLLHSNLLRSHLLTGLAR